MAEPMFLKPSSLYPHKNPSPPSTFLTLFALTTVALLHPDPRCFLFHRRMNIHEELSKYPEVEDLTKVVVCNINSAAREVHRIKQKAGQSALVAERGRDGLHRASEAGHMQGLGCRCHHRSRPCMHESGQMCNHTPYYTPPTSSAVRNSHRPMCRISSASPRRRSISRTHHLHNLFDCGRRAMFIVPALYSPECVHP